MAQLGSFQHLPVAWKYVCTVPRQKDPAQGHWGNMNAERQIFFGEVLHIHAESKREERVSARVSMRE
jgi:hypothetical protein